MRSLGHNSWKREIKCLNDNKKNAKCRYIAEKRQFLALIQFRVTALSTMKCKIRICGRFLHGYISLWLRRNCLRYTEPTPRPTGRISSFWIPLLNTAVQLVVFLLFCICWLHLILANVNILFGISPFWTPHLITPVNRCKGKFKQIILFLNGCDHHTVRTICETLWNWILNSTPACFLVLWLV
jgi:hypothetical protein